MKKLITFCTLIFLLLGNHFTQAQRRPSKSVSAATMPTVVAVAPSGGGTGPQPMLIDSCGTPDPSEQKIQSLPWYGDTLYLPHYADSLMAAHGGTYRTSVQGVEDVWLRIPIQFWVYTEGNTPGPGNYPFPTAAKFQALIDNANNVARANNMPVRYYLLCPNIVYDPDAVVMNNVTEMTLIGLQNKNPSAINIHISQSVPAAQYNSVSDAIYIGRIEFSSLASSLTTISHEIGHYFGLDHTFLFSKVPCLREPVSRGYVWRPLCPQSFFPKTCAVTGDLLTDTPADHEDLKYDTPTMTACDYLGSRTDFWGRRFDPDEANYMSYIGKECRRTFSQQQQTIMLRSMFRRSANVLRNTGIAWELNTDYTRFDRWEPDNQASIARALPVDEVQERSLADIGCEQDEEFDWLTFQLFGASSSYVLDLSDVSGYVNPVGSVAVFIRNFDGSAGASFPLTQIPAPSGKKLYVLACGDLNNSAGQTMLIRVLRGIGLGAGRYRISLTQNAPQLTGPNGLCGGVSAQFLLSNILPGTIKNWSVTPSGALAINEFDGGASVTATGSSSNATLTVTLNENGCTQTLSKSLTIGSTPSLQLTANKTSQQTCRDVYDFVATGSTIASDFEWTINQTLHPEYNGQSTISLTVGPPFEDDLEVDVTVGNLCSGTRLLATQSVNKQANPQCYGQRSSGSSISIYPNPANNTVLFSSAALTAATLNTMGAQPNAKAGTQTFQVDIRDSRGKPVYQETASNGKLQVNTAGLPSGLYHVIITDGQNVHRENLSIEH